MPGSAAGLTSGQYARSLVRRLAALTAVLLLAVWALTGRGYFWPAWAWLGLIVVVLCDYSAGWVWRHRPGAPRRVAGMWAAIAVAATILVATWLLTWLLADAHTFWPAWALLGLATVGSAYSLIALHDRVLIANGARALRERTALLKTRIGALRAFIGAQRRLAKDGVVLDRAAVTRLLEPSTAPEALLVPTAGSSETLDRLTVREREVLALMADGRSNGAIAERLVVSLGAIEKHITSIFTKLDLPACDDDHRRVLAVVAYLRRPPSAE
jgi:DNA-binding CsgD family transcriptional regulator